MDPRDHLDLDPVLGRNGLPEKFHGDSSDVTTDEALKFIRANKAKPFFLYFAHNFPHVPLFASEKFHGQSRRGL